MNPKKKKASAHTAIQQAKNLKKTGTIASIVACGFIAAEAPTIGASPDGPTIHPIPPNKPSAADV